MGPCEVSDLEYARILDADQFSCWFVSENEPEIRGLLHHHTSWSAVEDKDCKGLL